MTNIKQIEMLPKADLKKANLHNAYLAHSILKEANLQSACLQSSCLKSANLEKANLCKANLRGTNLEKTNLKNTNLRQGNLQFADVKNANFWGADLRKADLFGIKNFTFSQLASVKDITGIKNLPAEFVRLIPYISFVKTQQEYREEYIKSLHFTFNRKIINCPKEMWFYNEIITSIKQSILDDPEIIFGIFLRDGKIIENHVRSFTAFGAFVSNLFNKKISEALTLLFNYQQSIVPVNSYGEYSNVQNILVKKNSMLVMEDKAPLPQAAFN